MGPPLSTWVSQSKASVPLHSAWEQRRGGGGLCLSCLFLLGEWVPPSPLPLLDLTYTHTPCTGSSRAACLESPVLLPPTRGNKAPSKQQLPGCAVGQCLRVDTKSSRLTGGRGVLELACPGSGEPVIRFSGILLQASCETEPLLKIKLCEFSKYIKSKDNKHLQLTPSCFPTSDHCSAPGFRVCCALEAERWSFRVCFCVSQHSGSICNAELTDAPEGHFFESPKRMPFYQLPLSALEENRELSPAS